MNKTSIKLKCTKMLVVACMILSIVLIFPFNVLSFSASDVANMNDEQIEVANTIGNFLVNEMGMTEAAALGVLGNIGAECGFDIAAKEAGPPQEGRGICQWSFGRREKLIAEVPDWETNLEGQLEYLKKELESGYSGVLEQLLELGNTEEDILTASWIWCKDFELPRDDYYDNYETIGKKIRAEIGKELAKILDFQVSSKFKDASFYQELFGGVSDIPIQNGSSIFNLDTSNREKNNLEIYNSIVDGVSTNPNSYSLYELYGPNIKLFEYLGEETTDITLMDYILGKGKRGEELKLEDINYESTVYLSNNVYKKRPAVLNTDIVKSGYFDPRVKAYNNKLSNTTKLNLIFQANFWFTIGQWFVSLTNLLVTNKFLVFIADKIDWLANTKLWQEILPEMIKWIIPIFIAIFIVSIVKYAFKFVNGHAGIKQVLIRFLTGTLALGLIFTAITNTSTLNNVVLITTRLIDDVFESSLNEVYQEDEVIASNITDPDLLSSEEESKEPNKQGNLKSTSTTEAAIWKVAIFQPWCVGMFNDKYENLYTQFSDKPDTNKLKQSHEDITKLDENDDTAHFDSATLTGDIKVDVGQGKQIQNWAAYAWSIQSTYHIDNSIFDNKDTIKNKNETKVWVPATTSEDGTLYADTFRIIDAKMNISPQYYSDGTSISSYSDANDFETHPIKAQGLLLERILLLLVMWPTIIRRLSAFLNLILTSLKLMYYSLIELVKENEGYSVLFSQFKHYLGKYIYTSMQLYILIYLYVSFIDKGFMWVVAYLIAAYVVTNVTVSDLSIARQKARTLRKKVLG